MKALLNLAAMQVSWFACVLGAAHQLPWLGVAVASSVVAVHLTRAANRRLEFVLVAVALSVGIVLDSALANSGVISFAPGSLVVGSTTPWMLGLWAGFATALTTSLRWIVSRPAVSVSFGALGGPTAYWSGAQLGAITLESNYNGLIAIALGWAAAMGIFSLIFLSNKLHYAEDVNS